MGKRLIQQRRGRGSSTYKSMGFKSKGPMKNYHTSEEIMKGTVIELISCSQHSAPLAKIIFQDGGTTLIAASEGMAVNDEIEVGGNNVNNGNCLPLSSIPEGTTIYNIELQPGDGGKLCRSSGTFARVASKLNDKVTITLPSKKQKTVVGSCRAIIGIVAGGGRTEKPILKAGNAYYKYKAKNKLWPIVSGGAMNAVDHPFGNKRSSRKSKAKPVPKNSPPGRKVGMLRPRQTGRSKR
jgi:large subunit ribosomal protein L2